MAEGERFELSIPCGMYAFQAYALGHYANPPPQAGLRFVAKILRGLEFLDKSGTSSATEFIPYSERQRDCTGRPLRKH